jgi:hypothetical protein
MATVQKQRFCANCKKQTLHARHHFGDGMGCLLSILTLGLFVPIWFCIEMFHRFCYGYRCQQCGEAN